MVIDDLPVGTGNLVSPQAVKVDRVDFPEVARDWETLEPRARTRNIFVSWPFAATWWEHFERGREDRVFVVREPDGSPVAILPLCVERLSTRFGPVGVLRNAGFGDVVNPDFLDALVLPGREEEAARALAPHLLAGTDWDFAEFSELEAGGSLVRMVETWREMGLFHGKAETRSICPYITLPATFEEYLNSQNAHFRHQLRRYRRRIDKELAPVWRRVGEDLGVAEGIEFLGTLHQERMEATGRGGNFRKEDYTSFHRDLAHRLSKTGELYFWVLFVQNQPAASHYGFLHQGTYFGYQMGFTSLYERFSLGHYMTGVVLEKLIEAGAREMNLLRGTDSWKFRWTKTTRRTAVVQLVRPAWRSRWARTAVGLSGSPALVLRFLLGRDNFDELRGAWKEAGQIWGGGR